MTDRDLTPDHDPSKTGVPGWAQMAGQAPVDPRAPVGPQTLGEHVSWMDVSLDDDGRPAGGGPRPPRARRRPGMVAVAAVGAGALVVVGFAAGRVLDGGTTRTSPTAQQVPAGQGLTDGGGPAGDGRAGGDGLDDSTMTVGRVTAVDGSTVTLAGRDGSTTVTTSSATSVDGTTGGDLSTLSTGDVVLVRGTRDDDGTWTATAIGTAPPLGREDGHGADGDLDDGGRTGGIPGGQDDGGAGDQGSTGSTTGQTT